MRCAVKIADMLSGVDRIPTCDCDVYVGGKVRVLEFMIFLGLQHFESK